MMKGILADANVQGHVGWLVRLLESAAWRDIWHALQLEVRTFADLGIAPDVADDLLWHACQRHELVLITRNRNAHGPTSLEITIQSFSRPDSLPVFTLADPDRVHAAPGDVAHVDV